MSKLPAWLEPTLAVIPLPMTRIGSLMLPPDVRSEIARRAQAAHVAAGGRWPGLPEAERAERARAVSLLGCQARMAQSTPAERSAHAKVASQGSWRRDYAIRGIKLRGVPPCAWGQYMVLKALAQRERTSLPDLTAALAGKMANFTKNKAVYRLELAGMVGREGSHRKNVRWLTDAGRLLLARVDILVVVE